MKIFLLRLVALFITVLLILRTIEFIASPYWGNDIILSKLNYLESLNNNSFDTYFIGSSRVNHQINPKLFDRLSKTNSFNLGCPSLSRIETLRIANDLIKEPLKESEEMLFERNPETKKRFSNLIKLRTAKIEHLKKLKETYPKKVFIINSESRLLTPRISVCNLEQKHGLKLKGPVKISMGYFGKNPKLKFNRKEYYKNKEYLQKHSTVDLDFVRSELDPKLEEYIGYKL